jgi:hypothetical protein
MPDSSALKYTDPDGLYEFAACNGDSTCLANQQKFRDAIAAAKKALASGLLSTKQAGSLSAVLNYLGDEGPGKGHGRIVFGSLAIGRLGEYQGKEVLKFDMKQIQSFSERKDPNGDVGFEAVSAGSVVHESRHALDNLSGLFPVAISNVARDLPLVEGSERRAYTDESSVYQGLNSTYPGGTGSLWRTNWTREGLSKATQEKLRSIGVEKGVKRSMDDVRRQLGIK